ncbi:hypothetical protein PAXRUDRAFT_167821 [Paxillus rubicundulus Ve08.2h10]|uniref:Unplaced genomic scaffold scaffold_2322, whole genome shotgun sequence n=1 Tax=Paxillus rubicundulus Ve08.2h10 TaxID=930991 RepID=A0A0D0DGN4_9AGAM|nr:hypothetical protein PAXRUDRAFT_167821 [Paxillus rubicundulus Ve08.2h10]
MNLLCIRTSQDPLVHHGHHFSQAVHAFCNVQILIMNGLQAMGDNTLDDENLTAVERKEHVVFHELLQSVPGLQNQLMSSSEEEVIIIADLIQKGVNGTRADDTKSMKGPIIDWITPKGQSLSPHIPCNVKLGHSPNHNHTGALLCLAGLNWNDSETCTKLANSEMQVAGDQWSIFLYANYTYDSKDPWNSLLCSGLLIVAFKHSFTSSSSVDQEPKAMHSGNAHIHSMHSTTKASLTYVATQARFALSSVQVFSCTDLITNSEHFYNSILELLDNPDERDKVDQLMAWWNHQVFPLYSEVERLPSKNSVLARIQQKCAEYNKRHGAGVVNNGSD